MRSLFLAALAAATPLTAATPRVFNNPPALVQRTPVGEFQAGDFNGDGRVDIAVPNGFYIDVSLANGDGTFALSVRKETTRANLHLAAGDINGDGRAPPRRRYRFL